MTAVPSRSERRVRSAPFRRYHGTRRHLFKRPDASYPWATEDMAMKLGLAIGYSGAHLDVLVALVQRG
jgi:hypothetical protein